MGSSMSSPASETLENETHETSKPEERDGTKTLKNQDLVDPIPIVERESLGNQFQVQVSASSNGENREGEDENEEEHDLWLSIGRECKDTYIAMESCIEEADEKKEDFGDKCYVVMSSLCESVVTSLYCEFIVAHVDHPEPMIEAFRAEVQRTLKEIKTEIEKIGLKDNTTETEGGKGK